MVDSSIAAVALALLLPFMGLQLSVALVWMPLLAILLVLLTTAAALFFSCANLFFRDVKYIVQIFLMFGIFFTPVFFEPAMFGPKGVSLMMLNPIAPVLEGFRLSIIEGHNLAQPAWIETTGGAADLLVWSPWHLVYSLAFGVLALLGAALLFHRTEQVFAEYA
jgi:ABC-type polysaccharide/polyol phosphate export permease